ncbi:MAG: MFS transporter [Desulfovibrio sp.]|uniref:MFS transporter n=1 Tax=Desulfovibrio sp. TaxID=885 RepID=UPI0039E28AAC
MECQNSSIANDTKWGTCERAMRRYRALIFIVISLSYIISYFHRSSTAVIGPVLMEDLKISSTDLGIVGSMYFWAYALACIPSGLLTDAIGARKTIAVFLCVAAGGTLLFAAADSVALLGGGRFCIGLGVSAVYIAAMKIFSDWYKKDELATCSGALLAVGNVGALLSTAPLVLLIAQFGWRETFVGMGWYTLVMGGVSYLLIRNTPSELGFSPVPQDIAVESERPTVFKALGTLLTNRNFCLLSLLSFMYYGTFMGVGALWAGPYLQDVYGLSRQAAAAVLMFFPIGMTIGCPLSGYLSDKVLRSRRSVLLYGCVLHLLAYIPFILFTSSMPTGVLYLLFLYFGISGGFFVSCFACAKEISHPAFAGTSIGALNMLLAFGAAFFQYVLGWILALCGKTDGGSYGADAYRMVFVAAAAGLIIGAVSIYMFRERKIL